MNAARIHILLAALMGASGVALWAIAAHRGGPSLATAAQMLLLHAVAVIALTAARKQGLVETRIARIAITILILGVALFSGDITARAFLGGGLFAMAAPLGGSLMILGWLMTALAAVWPHQQQ
jgi:uncharacterized membrane protein YgdD (TMEM256/DUF423 family)